MSVTAALAETLDASGEAPHVVYWIHLRQQRNPFLEGYVGVANDLERRWRRHKSNVDVLRTKRNGFPLYVAFRNHGLDRFKFEFLVHGLDKWSAHNLEYALHPHAHIGYNLELGGYWRSCTDVQHAQSAAPVTCGPTADCQAHRGGRDVQARNVYIERTTFC